MGSPGKVCQGNELVIRSEHHCKLALQTLGYQVSNEKWTGKMTTIPSGCSINKKMAYHFNSIDGTGTGRGDLTPICRSASNKGKFDIMKPSTDS